MNYDPLNTIDFYKADHRRQYPSGTQFVYSNFTPRSSRLAPVPASFDNRVVFVGLQGFIKNYLIKAWDEGFFSQPKEQVLAKYKKRMDKSLGENAVPVDHIADLHDLGYLPLSIKALPEGSRVNIKVPMLTVINTLPAFFWLTNYIETAISAEIWKPSTTATIALEYRKLFTEYAIKTAAPLEFVDIQGHDFSSRGMSGIVDAAQSGFGHLTSFIGTDTVAAIDYAEDVYNAVDDIVGVSVPATEHSVMSMGLKESEVDTFRYLIKDLYSTGVVSIVSDTWDFWKVITKYSKILKDDILARQENALGLAKVVFRPDSGDPVKVISGDADAVPDSPEYKGAVECLWDIFGGTISDNGYKMLNERVGLIYGDSITLPRAKAILKGLEKKGFASNNIVFGIGSYTYQYITRDSFGFAMKATWGQVNNAGRNITKDPVTDRGDKKSASGLLRVEKDANGFVLFDEQSKAQESRGLLKTVFENGKLLRETNLSDIRARLRE